MIGTIGRGGAFEVTANGTLLHSKLEGQGGMIESDEEYQALVTKLKAIIN